MAANRFVIWPGTASQPATLDPLDHLTSMPLTDVRYLVRILAELDALMPNAGLTFVLTWHLDAYDEVMKDAVVLLIGDEMYQIPSYSDRVRVIFKTGGLRRNPVAQTLQLPFSVAWRVLVRDARNLAKYLRRSMRDSRAGTPRAPILLLPLGYYALQEMDAAPLEQRPVDVFFAGALSVSGWSVRPSVHARKQMSAALSECRRVLPEHRIESTLDLTGGSRSLSPLEYTRALADSRIALAPRGNFDETFRLFEAAKLGCVIVSEPLPPRWYYEGCPVQTLRGWSELPVLLSTLLRDKARLCELSERTRQWWDQTLCEPAIARFIQQRIPSS